MLITLEEQKKYLRQLGTKLVELAETEKNKINRLRWAKHNDLLERSPLIWVCPDDNGAWCELITESELQCTDPLLRDAELKIMKYLYQGKHLNDDFVYEKRLYFNYPGTYTGVLYGNNDQTKAWGVSFEAKKVSSNAYHLDKYINTPQDIDRFLSHEVDFIPDYNELNRLENIYNDIFDGVLEIEFQLPYSVLVQSLLIELVHLYGFEDMLYDLYDNPDILMKMLHHMGESKARLLQKLEKEKLLFDNRINIYTGSGGLGYTMAPWEPSHNIKLSDMWGFADAQEFSNVSPKMFQDFAIENQKIGLNLFGKACYACCEPMDKKYDVLFQSVPNIRRISVSPWTDVEEAASKIGKKAIFSYKPNPAEICLGFDEEAMLKKLKSVANISKDCFVEIILKDLRTCDGTPIYFQKFIELARRAFE